VGNVNAAPAQAHEDWQTDRMTEIIVDGSFATAVGSKSAAENLE
jgi:hypothetical protein